MQSLRQAVRAVQWGKQEDFHATFKAGRRDSGLQGYRKGGIRTAGIHEGRHSRLEGFRTGGIQERRDSILEGFRTGVIQERRDLGMEGFRTAGIEERKDSGL